MKKFIPFKRTIFIAFLVMIFSSPVFSQDEDWKKMMEEAAPAVKEKVTATFKTTRIINAQSIETVKHRTLDFRVTHRFGAIGYLSGGDKHNLYGFDVSSDIRIGFEYGITDRLTLGFARCKRRENLQGLLKYRLLQQTKDNSMPVSVTVYSDLAFTPEKDIDSSYLKWEHRMNYTTQLIIARKFSSRLSVQLMPTYIHRNYVNLHDDENDLFSLGVGGRIKITKRSAVIFDYYHTFSKFRDNAEDFFYVKTEYFAPLGLGWEIETGGHVFSILFTNCAGILESDYIPYTTDSWLKGGMRFSFNISRNFRL